MNPKLVIKTGLLHIVKLVIKTGLLYIVKLVIKTWLLHSSNCKFITVKQCDLYTITAIIHSATCTP